ncbi:MAG: hypothetical protein AAF698_03675 [Pseudomonadota bacterium]
MKNAAKRTAARIALTLFLLPLGACGAVVIETGTVAVDKATVWRNIDDARADDPAAQYSVGDALCCSGDVPDGTIYSTVEAMQWLCAAAGHGNADAMLKLGKIFEGDQVDGLRLVRRAVTAMSTTPTNRAAAHYWYDRADEAHLDGAADDATALYQELTATEKTLAALYASASTPPCGWADLSDPALVKGTSGLAPEQP